ncbi:metal-dependent hydrolase [Pseudonocardia ailaonensis]|uniref:Metal-dependent hydrolase n=1 Tax=Pseudonocardia ailaonensis TaxID=367279 RepID=A0ABN2MNF7_9PSEU
MLGVSHATSGAALGLAVAGLAPQAVGMVATVGTVLTFAGVTAGAALLPDLDHPSSTATRRFSWASWLAARAVRPFSALLFRLTRGPRDTGRGTHRGLTHTLAGALLLGGGTAAASARWGTPVTVGVLFVCLALAIKGLDGLVPGPPSLVIAAGLTWAAEEKLPGGTAGAAGWLGIAVGLGMLVHSLGDAITESGAPIFWPVSIRGRRWFPVGSPRPLRFRAGGRVEMLVVAPLLTALTLGLAVWVVPGVADLVTSVREHLGAGG